MSTVKKEEIKTVQLNTAIIIGLCALIVGFLAGNLYYMNKSAPGTAVQSTTQNIPIQNSARMFALENEVRNNPNNRAALLELGNMYFDSNKYQDAIQTYNKYLNLNPNNPDVWTDLGVMYRRAKNSNNAILSFDKAMKVNPRHEHSRFNKGIVLYYDMGLRSDAVKLWQELSKINPNFRTPEGKTITEFLKKL